MSADGSPKLPFVPYASAPEQKARRPRSCGFCDLPIDEEQFVVLLTSGRSVHFECYIELRQRPPETRT